MFVHVLDVPVQPLTEGWSPGWRGPRRFAMLTTSLVDPGRFVAYGADGFIAFRVEGSWRGDLASFMARMAVDGVELLLPPTVTPACEGFQPTCPDPRTVQRCLEMRVGMVAAA